MACSSPARIADNIAASPRSPFSSAPDNQGISFYLKYGLQAEAGFNGNVASPNPVPSRHLRKGRKARKANRETLTASLNFDK